VARGSSKETVESCWLAYSKEPLKNTKSAVWVVLGLAVSLYFILSPTAGAPIIAVSKPELSLDLARPVRGCCASDLVVVVTQ